MKECNVVFITDENYAMPTSVAIVSLIMNYKGKSSLNIYILGDGLSDESKHRLSLCKEVNDIDVVISIIDVNNDISIKAHEIYSSHISKSTFIKFRIPQVLKGVDKVLFLDSDVIVCKDISPVFEYNIDDLYLASVEDIDLSRVKADGANNIKRISMPVNKYFNSGVMYLNLEKMRKDDITRKLIENKRKHPKHLFDKDSLNFILYENRLEIPWKYNFLSAFTELLSIDELNRYYGCSYGSMDALVDEAVVLHFAGEHKPWIYDMPFTTIRFIDYYRVSPYRDVELKIKSYIRELDNKYAELYKQTDFLRKPKRLLMRLLGK